MYFGFYYAPHTKRSLHSAKFKRDTAFDASFAYDNINVQRFWGKLTSKINNNNHINANKKTVETDKYIIMMNIALLSFDANGMRRVWRVLKILKYGLMWETVWQFCQWQCNRYFTSELPKMTGMNLLCKEFHILRQISFSKMYEKQSVKLILQYLEWTYFLSKSKFSWESLLTICLTKYRLFQCGRLLFYGNSKCTTVWCVTLNDWFVIWTILILIDSMQRSGIQQQLLYARCALRNHFKYQTYYGICTMNNGKNQ